MLIVVTSSERVTCVYTVVYWSILLWSETGTAVHSGRYFYLMFYNKFR